MNSKQLFRRSRLRLALWYAIVMGVILSASGFGMYRSVVQSNWAAMEREMESIAGTLHDSLEPMLPASENPTTVLRRILPELCLAGQPCDVKPSLIQRHTTGISDRNTYYIRLLDHHNQLVAFSPSHPFQLTEPVSPELLSTQPWKTLRSSDGIRYHQFTIILHSANRHQAESNSQYPSHPSWGYLQIGRNLAAFDAEIDRIQWILTIAFPITLSLVVISSWGLSGLAMTPIYQSYEQQKLFTANAAHELRSPLASLLATVEALMRIEPVDQQQIDLLLGTIDRQGRRLSHLISDLLLLSSIEQKTSSKDFQPCCLNDLITDLSEEFLELAVAAEITLYGKVPNSPIHVLGHEQQLYRLMSNLIANAIHYTPANGTVTIELEHRDRSAMITIKDTGIGIPTAEQTHIFERFYRVENDRSRKTGGTGLGLAIARAIVQHHKGSITVKSDVGQGSLFIVQLPGTSRSQS